MGDVLTEVKPDVISKLVYGTGSRPIEFEDWMRKTRFNLAANHSLLVKWWDAVCANARRAYDSYLSLSPLQRSSVRPAFISQADGVIQQCEHYMVAHLLTAMPQHIERMLLHTPATTSADIIFHAMIDAGPGTAKDRASTLNSVGSKGPAVAVRQIYGRLQRWRFEMVRLAPFGVAPPDPTAQMNALTPFAQQLADANVKSDYRLNAFRLATNMAGAVTQEQVADLWAYLVAEAREAHGNNLGQSTKKTAGSQSIASKGAGEAQDSGTKCRTRCLWRTASWWRWEGTVTSRGFRCWTDALRFTH